MIDKLRFKEHQRLIQKLRDAKTELEASKILDDYLNTIVRTISKQVLDVKIGAA